MSIDVLGIDLAKNVFQLHGVDRNRQPVFKRRVMRDQLLSVVGALSHVPLRSRRAPAHFAGRVSSKRSATR